MSGAIVHDLCKHVTYEETTKGAIGFDGIASPIFGWDPERAADVPLLKCTKCGATTRLEGVAVYRKGDPLEVFDGEIKQPPDPDELVWDDIEEDDVEWE